MKRNSSGSTRRLRGIRLVISTLLSILLLLWILQNVDLQEAKKILVQANLFYILLAFIGTTFNLLLRAYRWRTLIISPTPIQLSQTFWITSIGYLGNYLLPARAGDLIRSILMGRRTNLGTFNILATTLTERIIDAIVLILIAGMSLSLTALQGNIFVNSFILFIIVIMGALLILLILLKYNEVIIEKIESNLVPDREWVNAIKNAFVGFLLGLRVLRSRSRMTWYLFQTAGIWSIDVFLAVLIAAAFGISISIPIAVTLLAAIGLGSAIPTTPGSIGIYQLITVAVLTFFGIQKGPALVFGISMQVLSYVYIIIWGLIGVIRVGGLETIQLYKEETERPLLDPNPMNK